MIIYSLSKFKSIKCSFKKKCNGKILFKIIEKLIKLLFFYLIYTLQLKS